jgi:hypothetical protein
MLQHLHWLYPPSCSPGLVQGSHLCHLCHLSPLATQPISRIPQMSQNVCLPRDAGVVVVNIDSGFGAAMAAWRILKNVGKLRKAIAAQK